MSVKDKWKSAGKGIGNAFKNFGKAVKTTAQVTFTDKENTVDENGESELKKAWKNTGKGFGSAGKSFGQAAKATVGKDSDDVENPDKSSEPMKDKEIVDVETAETK